MIQCQLCNNCKFTNTTILDKVYYEIHITVEYDLDFISFCNINKIKVINIELGDDIPNHLMTSISMSFNSDDECFIYITKLEKEIKKNFKILRTKVEVSPNHIEVMNPKNYFESHIAISNPNSKLDKLCYNLNIHKSKNLLKRDNNKLQMLTYRDTIDINSFKNNLDNIINKLKNEGFIIKKYLIEYCLYDSNIQLDNKWLSK